MAAESEAPELNGTLLSLVLIFIPGIICYGIIVALAEKKERSNVTLLLQVFMYGVFSYLILACVHWLIPCVVPGVESLPILRPSEIEKAAIDPKTIGWASFFGGLLGACISFNLNRQYLLKFFRHIRLTERFGDEDVWTLLLNSTDTDNYATIIYREKDLIYQGYVSGFSSKGETRELLLINVIVYLKSDVVDNPDIDEASSSSNVGLQQVGEIPFLYLSFKDNDITLEFGQKAGN